MTKIEIISGFLGAGKTTLIRKFLEERDASETVAIIENEFGEVGIDGFALQQSGVSVREINAGCICCSLVGNFDAALRDLLKRYQPDRIIIEPSGVGKLSDILTACKDIGKSFNASVSFCATVVDAKKYMMYRRNFAEFYENQIAATNVVLLSRTDLVSAEGVKAVAKDIARINPNAHLVATSWDKITSEDIRNCANLSMKEFAADTHNHRTIPRGARYFSVSSNHSHDRACGEKPVDHKHAAADVFSFWGVETPIAFAEDQLCRILESLSDARFGTILRAKGMIRLASEEAKDCNEEWRIFDYVEEEIHLIASEPGVIGKICVIGQDLNRDALEDCFGV